MKRLIAHACLLLCCLLLAACGSAPDYADVETVAVESDTGFSFQIPADWQVSELNTQNEPQISSDAEAPAEYGLYECFNAAGSMSLLVLAEYGGMEYNSTQELCDLMSDSLLASLFAEGEKTAVRGEDTHFNQQISGKDVSGNDIVCQVYIWHPYTALRYYMIFIATADAFAEEAYIVDGIESSFVVTKGAEEMYQWIQDKRSEANQPVEDTSDEFVDEQQENM